MKIKMHDRQRGTGTGIADGAKGAREHNKNEIRNVDSARVAQVLECKDEKVRT